METSKHTGLMLSMSNITNFIVTSQWEPTAIAQQQWQSIAIATTIVMSQWESIAIATPIVMSQLESIAIATHIVMSQWSP